MEIIANLSSNTPASIRAAIDAEHSKHPALGLRQAELIIYDRTKALAEYRYHDRKSALEALHLDRQLQRLRTVCDSYAQRWWYILRHRVAIDIEIGRLELELQKLQSEREFAQPLIRDAVSELAAAIDRRERILIAHPALNVSPERFQELFAEPTYLAKISQSPLKTINLTASDPQSRQNYLCPEQLPS